MTDSREGDDQVDFEDDNYEEEMDQEVEEQIEEEEEEDEDNRGEENEEEASGGEGDKKRKRGDEKASSDVNNEKHAELLALPPHGSEIFIGGLSKDVNEEDLSELCEPFGDVVEVAFSICIRNWNEGIYSNRNGVDLCDYIYAGTAGEK